MSEAAPFSAWERSLAARYLRTKRKNGGVALISIIAFLGIMAAVAVLIITMSIMNGFRVDLQSRMLGFKGHVFIQGAVINGPDRDPMLSRIRAIPGVAQAFPIIESPVMVVGPNTTGGGIVRAMRPADTAATPLIANHMVDGSLKAFGEGDFGGDNILAGVRMAQTQGVHAGDQLTLISASGAATAFGSAPRRKAYTVTGLFTAGVSEYDQAFIYMPLEQAQAFFGKGDSVDEIEINLSDLDQLDRIRPLIEQAAGQGAIVTDWRDQNKSFWNAIQVEKNALRLILMMIVAIAMLNIISGLIMLVKNKSRDIAILRTIGAGQGSVLRVFFMAGATIGITGAVAGLIFGALFCIFLDPLQAGLEAVGIHIWSADTYFLNRIPHKIEWSEVATVVAFSIVMSVIATLPPAWRASRLDPIEALRYE
ncbi:lipoprotein-releasing ABC transporter permease subunit [soil metagenome]